MLRLQSTHLRYTSEDLHWFGWGRDTTSQAGTPPRGPHVGGHTIGRVGQGGAHRNLLIIIMRRLTHTSPSRRSQFIAADSAAHHECRRRRIRHPPPSRASRANSPSNPPPAAPAAPAARPSGSRAHKVRAAPPVQTPSGRPPWAACRIWRGPARGGVAAPPACAARARGSSVRYRSPTSMCVCMGMCAGVHSPF
jgi:hypothetical protein